MAEKYTTLFNFEIEGVESVEKGMQEISKILMPTKELGALIGKLGVDLSSFFENVGKGMKLDDAGIDTVFKDISQSIRAMTEDFSFKGITIDTGPISEEIKVLEEKVRQGTERVKELQEKLEKEKQQMLSDMATKYGQPIDEAFLDGTKAAAKLNKINADISKNTKDTSKETKEALLEEAENFKNFTKDLKTYFEKRKSLGSQLGGTQKGLGINTVKLEEAKGNKALSEQINTKELEKEEKAVRELADAYNFLIKIMKYLHDLKIEEQNKILAKRTKEQAEAAKLATKEEENLEEAMNKGEKTMAKKLATGLSYYTIFNQIKKIVKLSIKTIQDLDAAMTKASIVTEMTRKETWKLLKSYQNLAHETGRTTSEIANLNAFFLQQGKSIKQAIEMTEAAAKSAAVAGTSLQDAANYITSAIHGFGLAADQAEVVADKFAALGAASASSFEEIAIAMSKVAPVAQSAGVGIDFMMGILAKGIHTTREAPEAIGTAMKTIFARMRELTDIGKATEDGMSLNRVEKALNSVNVDLRDVTGQFRNLEDVLIDVGMKWDTLNSMEQAYLATALAGTRQQPRLLAILNDFDTTMDFIKISTEAEDELMYQHMDYMEGMEAASNNLKNSWEQIITSIVNADAIIGVTQALAFILDKIASVVEWITEKTALLISLLTVIIPLAINRVALLIAEYNARRKKNKEVIKGHKLEKISLVYSLKTIKAAIGLLFELAAQRREIRKLNKEKEKENRVKLKSFFASALETLGIKGTTGALKAQAAVWPLVTWYVMIFIAAIAVLALAVYGIIKLFTSLSKSVDDYAKAINKSNKKIHESKKKVKAVKDLQEEYDTLNNKVNKTNEDLERMNEILEELSDHDENYDFVVDGEINRKELTRYELDEMRKQGKERAKQLKNATASASKNLTDSLDDPSVMKVFQKYGETIADSLVVGLDEEMAENVKTSLHLQIDTKEIAKEFSELGTKKGAVWKGVAEGAGKYLWTGGILPLIAGLQGGLNAGKEYEKNKTALEKTIVDRITELKNTYEKAHSQMAEVMDDSLLVQLEKLDEVSKEVGEGLSNSFRSAYSELNALSNAAKAFGIELKDIVDIIENLERRGISSDDFIKKLEKYAFGSFDNLWDWNGGYLIDEIADDIKDYKKVNNDINSIQAKLQVAYQKENNEEEIKNLEDELNKKLNIKSNLEATLPVKTFKEAYISAALYKHKDDLLKLTKGDKEFDAEEFVKNMSEELYTNLIIDFRVPKEEEISLEEAFTTARNIALDLTTSAEKITEKFKKTGQVITDSLKLPQELIQGNFETLDKLAGELGANGLDILKRYFKTGDMSEIQGELNARLEDEINLRLEVLRTAEKLSQEEELEIFKLEQQLKYIQAFSNEYDIWNEKIKDSNKLLEISKSTLSFLDKLEDLELNIKIEGAEEFANSVRDVALTEIGTNVKNAADLKKDAIQKMIDAELMNESGKMIASAKTYDQRMALENYYLANEVWEEAINGGVEIVEQELNRLKKEQEKEKKFIEDSHKERMDILKKQYDEKWKAIDYENKLLDLQEKVTEARNKLATAMFSGDASGQKDATKALKEAREARQKEIESQILDKIQKEEEEKKNERLEKIQKNIETYTQDMATALEKLLNSEGGEGLKVKLNNLPELDKTDEDEKDVLKEEVYNASEDREKLITLVGGVKEGVKEIANSLKNKDTSQTPTNTDRGSKPKGGGKPNLDLKAMLG